MARRHTSSEQGPGIVVLYTSLMILLLAFFILLNSMGRVEEAKVETALKSLQQGFGVLGGGDNPLPDQLRRRAGQTGAPIMPVEQDYLYLRGLVGQEGLSKDVLLLRSHRQRTAVLTEGLLFEPGSLTLTPRAQEFLRQVAEVLKERLYPVSLYGHLDPVGPDGLPLDKPGQEGWDLSAQRALAVLRFLASQGVEANRLAAFGMGGYRPMVSESNPEHWRLNNRVEMVFDARDASLEMIPRQEPAPKLDFRGFSFDLLPDQKEK